VRAASNTLENVESDREICLGPGNCSDPGEKSLLRFSNTFHSTVSKPIIIVRDRLAFAPGSRTRVDRRANAGQDTSVDRNTIGLMTAAQRAALRKEDTVGMIIVIDCEVTMFVASLSPVAHPGLDHQVHLALHRTAVGI
jgi:hypothetical protein